MLLLCRKTERKISYDQFMDAFRMVAEKKYPGDPNCVKVLERKVLQGSGPSMAGTTVSGSGRCVCVCVCV